MKTQKLTFVSIIEPRGYVWYCPECGAGNPDECSSCQFCGA